MKNKLLYILGILITLQLSQINTITGASFTWTGNTSSSWAVSTNWSGGGGGTPGSGDNITINSNAPNNLVLDQNRTVTNFTINGDTLDLGTYTLTTTGVTYFNGGLVNNGNLSISGSLCHFGSGSIIDARIQAECGYYHMNGGLFKKASFLVSTGSASTSGTGNCVFEDTLSITNNGTFYFTMSSSTGNVYQGPLLVTNNSTREVLLATNDTSYFNDILLSNTNGGGIIFGNTGGISYLASAKTISIDTGGFINDYLTLNNFNQLGTTSQNLTLTGTALVNMSSCTFNGSLSVNAPGFLIKNCTFNGVTSLGKTGTASLHCYGGNVFGAETTISNFNATGRIRLATTTGDTYLGQVTFEGEEIQVAYAGTNDFYSHIDNDGYTSSDVVFDAGSGTCRMMGDSNQELTGTNHNYRKLVIAQGYSTERDVFYDVEVTIKDTLNLISGRLIPFPLATLTMKAGSKVIGGSDSSFVSGPMKKIGNTEFEFPIGKENFYRPLKISAPTTSTHAFTAEYFNTGQPFGENLDTTLAYIDDCSYWNLTRNVGSSEVFVTLSWESGECPVKDTTYLKIASWYDDNWNDLGHGTITGNYSSGKMTSLNELIEYGNLTWVYDISLLSEMNSEQYSRGFGFVENLGQLVGTDSLSHPEVLFYGDAGNTTLYIQDSVFSYVFTKSHVDTSLNFSTIDSLYRIDMKLLGQNPEYEIQAFDTSQGTRNYFLGQLEADVTHALSFQEVRIKNCYPGIDLAFNNNDEFKFYVDSAADISDIKFYYQGNDSIQSANGVVSIYTLFGIKKYSVKSYEFVDNQWNQSDIEINIEDSLISFTLESENRNVPIIISVGIPNFSIPIHGPQNKLKWSTYVGGGGNVDELFNDVVIDLEDNIYVVGESIALNFPTTPFVVQEDNAGNYDVTVIKFKSNRSIDFCTYLGGSDIESGFGIAIDENKNVAIVGITQSSDFAPCSPPCGGYLQALTSSSNAFISILDHLGQNLLMSTYYGGSSHNSAKRVAFDNANNLVVAGKTAGSIPLPTPNSGFYQDHNGSDDVFIAKFDNSNELVWATHLGGDGGEVLNDLKIDIEGNVYLAGESFSESTSNLGAPCFGNTSTDFPICSASVGTPYLQSNSIANEINGFVCKFGTDNLLYWSTLFGGSQLDACFGIEVSKLNGDIFLVGITHSSSSDNFPLFTLSTSNLNDDDLDFIDGFIAMFNSEFEQQWCTYFGGNDVEDVRHISQNESGQIYVVGMTNSTDLNVFPSNGYYDGILNLNGTNYWHHDIFILKFNSSKELVYSTYFGGESSEIPYGMDFQFQNFTGKYDLIIVGHTFSANDPIPANSQQFPLSNYIGSPGIPYYEPMLNSTPNGPAAFISNIYNVSTPLRIGGTAAMPKQTVIEGFIEVFPNPLTDILNLGCINCFIYQITVFDLQGRKVYSNQKEELVSKVQLDLSFLNSGIYFVETWDGDMVYVNKIVKL